MDLLLDFFDLNADIITLFINILRYISNAFWQLSIAFKHEFETICLAKLLMMRNKQTNLVRKLVGQWMPLEHLYEYLRFFYVDRMHIIGILFLHYRS